MISLGRWQFDFNEPLVIGLSLLLLASLLLSLQLVAKRLVRRAPLRAAAVMFLNVVAYGIVFLLLLEPRLSKPAEQAVTLITEGAELTGISRRNSARLYIAPDVPASPGLKKRLRAANWLLDTTQLPLREPALNTIEVHGFGLDEDQWRYFPENIQVGFSPPEIIGFTAMRWPRLLFEGETLRVSGHYRPLDSEAIVEIRLLDPADNIVDETRIKNGQGFSLATRIKAPGNLTYRLQAWLPEIMLAEQIIPLEAATGRPLNIMVKQSAPSFETRALKSYAARQGHRIRLNTDISKGKNIELSSNLPADANASFTPQLLAEQDLLIIDGRALSDLPPTQIRWLSAEVSKGLGLLVLADTALLENTDALKTSLLSGFHLAQAADAELMINPRSLTGEPTSWQVPITVAAMQLQAAYADVLIDDGTDRSLVVRRPEGLGQVGISLIRHSDSWLTAGQQAAWSDYWSTLIASLSRQRDDTYLLAQAETAIHRVNQRAQVCAFTTGADSRIMIDPQAAPGQQLDFELQVTGDRLNSPRHCVYFWPEVSGWHKLQLFSPDGSVKLDQKSIYIFQPEQWRAQQRNQRVHATLARMAENRGPVLQSVAKWTHEPLSLFWLWLTLILSASLLWLERKLDSV